MKLSPAPPLRYQPGDRVGRLTVIEYVGRDKGYRCLCECGREAFVHVGRLKVGTRSCGCLRRDGLSARATIHGHSRARKGKATPTYKSWQGMRQRCENPNNDKWKHYGARGIEVCERWQSFENFLADMGERPEGLTLDRIDGDRGYEPGNCRWADATTQSRNRKKKR